jgi:hypothetical protein
MAVPTDLRWYTAALIAVAVGVALALWLAPFTVDPVPGFHPEAEIPPAGPVEVAPPALAQRAQPPGAGLTGTSPESAPGRRSWP